MSRFYTNVAVYGDNILVREIDNSGRQIKRKVKYQPTLFYNDPSSVEELKRSPWKNIHGDPLIAHKFDSIKDARSFLKLYEDLDDFKIYGLQRFQYTWLNEEYPDEVKFDMNLIRMGGLDIETAKDDEGFGDPQLGDKPITLISISDRSKGLMHTFGYKEPYDNDDPSVIYYDCTDEVTMLLKFLDVWEQINYDVFTSWNGEAYDVPYLINRINRLLGEEAAKRLSPWRILRSRDVELYGKPIKLWTIVGVAHLDYLNLYKKFTQNQQESYKLNHISFVELGEEKINYSEFESLQDLYEQDFPKFVRYNIKDVRLVDKLDDKKKLINLALNIAYMTKINYEDALTTVTLWDVYIHNYLWKNNIAVSPLDPNRIDRRIEGAYVKEPVPGFYTNIESFDVESLYPSLIIQYNISPEMYYGRIQLPSIYDIVYNNAITKEIQTKIKSDDVTLCASGLMFRRDKKGFIPTLVDQIFMQRKSAKQEMLRLEKEAATQSGESKEATLKEANILDIKQGAYKVLINGLYGALGNYNFRWYMADFAESVTLSGQMTIRNAEKGLNEYLTELLGPSNQGYVIAIDTDSTYLHLGEKFNQDTVQDTINALDEFAKQQLTPVIDGVFANMADVTNAYVNRIRMKREVIADKAIWTGKKHYAMNVWDKEGTRYNEPKMKIMGLEAVKSSTALAAREGIKGAIKCMFSNSQSDLFDFVDKFYFKFAGMAADDLAKPTSVQGLYKYSDPQTIYKKGTPYHVKGALIYNKLLRDKGLDTKYELIADGEKIKVINLNLPNPANAKSIAFKGFLPPELGLDKYINFQEQYEKMFLNPVTSLAEARGWFAERHITVDDAF